jgi:hypothetical protein
MQKLHFLTFLCFFLSFQNYGQDSTALNKEQADSIYLDELKSFLDSSDAPASYVGINAGFGNRLFSRRNNSLNSKQSTSSTLIFSPTVGYFHKSGFSLSAGANLLNDASKGFGISQYSITSAFDLTGNNSIGFGIAYSHYFVKDKYSPFSSPVQNDFYSYATFKKTWLEPGVAIGYSSGKFTEVFKFKVPLTEIVLIDTGTYAIRSFSLIASASHNFEWYEVLSKRDGIIFTPTFQINLSSDSTKSVSHTIHRSLLRNLKLKRRVPKLQGKNSFEVQSLGINLNINYSIGKFSFEPQLYVDYFLPKSDEKRFTSVFALSLGYAF